jgi:SAM-dependent methyltransferase
VTARTSFHVADARRALPSPDASFDALFCNDTFNHFPRRAEVLREWRRVLRPGGRVVVTDPVVVTGPVTNAEIRARSAIGTFLFAPAGYNERLFAECGFALDEVRDVTDAVAAVSGRWMDARDRRRADLIAIEGDASFAGLQEFLHAVHTLSRERRLSRYMYVATRRA